MSNVVIQVENLSKQYRLGAIGTGSLKDDLKRWRYKAMGKGDPFLMEGEENDRTVKSKQEYVWALKDINFEVRKGEVMGIVGQNGAGKSTLLKILSRTTGPTTGSVKVKGRIASLLEVGTGFHGELSGRENIFLNGAIMGMTKAEIKKKFDEIVDFAGVEKYIDTPVKRYSSGMYVRLAFGVAAHLEPDILIVDEVLAVGDAEFQRKALGKMKDVSATDGRTVLFVSHNMGAVKTLCENGIILRHGRIHEHGPIGFVLEKYMDENINSVIKPETLLSKCGRVTLHTPYFSYANGKKTHIIAFGEDVFLNFDLNFLTEMKSINPGFALVRSHSGERIFTSHLKDDVNFKFTNPLEGRVMFKTRIDLRTLAPGHYHVIYGVRDEGEKTIIYSEANVPLEISKVQSRETGNGLLWHLTKWQISQPNILSDKY